MNPFMPTPKKHKAPKISAEPTSPFGNGEKRYVHWLCSPGNVCVPQVEQKFTESPQWRIFRIMAEFIEGFEFLSKLKGEVSVFGSARAMPDDPFYKAAQELGYKLGKKGYTMVTGGGPGIMEAGNKGAFEAGAESVGLNIELQHEQRTNQYVKKAIGFHYFFTRKVMLSASAQAYVFFPGGFGTLDEMTEMVTLVQTGKIPMNVPVILYGKKFWKPFFDWVYGSLCDEHGFVDRSELKIIRLVDTVDEAIKIIAGTSERDFG